MNQLYAASSYWSSNVNTPRNRLNKTAATLLGAGLGAVAGGVGAAATDNNILGGAALGAGLGAGAGYASKAIKGMGKAGPQGSADAASGLMSKAHGGSAAPTTITTTGNRTADQVRDAVALRNQRIQEAPNQMFGNTRTSDLRNTSNLAGQRQTIANRLENIERGATQHSTVIGNPGGITEGTQALLTQHGLSDVAALRKNKEIFSGLTSQQQAMVKNDLLQQKRLQASDRLTDIASQQRAIHNLNPKLASAGIYSAAGAGLGAAGGYLTSGEKSTNRERLLRAIVGGGAGAAAGYGLKRLRTPPPSANKKSLSEAIKDVDTSKLTKAQKDLLDKIIDMTSKTASATGAAVGAAALGTYGGVSTYLKHRKVPGQSMSEAEFAATRKKQYLDDRSKQGLKVSILDRKLNEMALREAQEAKGNLGGTVAKGILAGALTGAAAGHLATRGGR